MNYSSFHRILAILFFLICTLIVVYSRELGQLRGFIGDIMIMMFLYSFIQGIYSVSGWKLTIMLLLIAYSVEYLQYLQFGTLMGWNDIPMMKLLFGATYDTMDIVAYSIGGVGIYYMDYSIFKWKKK